MCIGEMLCRLITKCVLAECADNAKATCSSTNLCAGLEAGIEGALRALDAWAREWRSLCFSEEEVEDEQAPRTAKEETARGERVAFMEQQRRQQKMRRRWKT